MQCAYCEIFIKISLFSERGGNRLVYVVFFFTSLWFFVKIWLTKKESYVSNSN